MSRRGIIRKILDDPAKKRELGIRMIIAAQAREGIITSYEQAEQAYDKVARERRLFIKRAGP